MGEGAIEPEQKCVLIERRGQLGILTLNRPAVINAINDQIREGFSAALQDLNADEAIAAIILTGAGERGVCVGADIKEGRVPLKPVGERRRLTPASWIEQLDLIAKPVIAVLHGFCLGGGLELALACDIRIAALGTRFALPETALGLIPGGGGTQRLPRLVGLARALDLLMGGEQIDEAEALRIGLVTRVAATAADALAEALRLGERIASFPPHAVAYVKEAAKAGLETDLAGGLKLEKALFALLTSTSDRAEAAAAFREKRSPVFTGQ
jgi:enoyl-CoA hydratase/carnithine racemase